MEEIYQNDLMELFMSEELPLLLENPGHIAKFLENIVPVLEERDWKIESNVNDFKVLDKPLDLKFSVESPKQNWFEFSQTQLSMAKKYHSMKSHAYLLKIKATSKHQMAM